MAAKTTLIIDIGNVLISTRPGAHYRKLAELTGLPASEIAERVDADQLPQLFERGRLDVGSFAAALRSCLASPELGEFEIHAAWNQVIGDPVPALIALVARVAQRHEVVLASNTNPLHWHVVRHRLAQAGLSAPAVLSHEVGLAKPDSRFFQALIDRVGRPSTAIFVDDRAANITAARAQRIDGWIHDDREMTINRIQRLFPTRLPPPARRR
jgi:HAD superfamily hydrolase (TIGR01509 family)